jgi:hypothetical protein
MVLLHCTSTQWDLQSFMLISLTVSEICPRQSSKCTNEQRAITPKLSKAELCVFALHFYLMRSIYLQSFMLISLIVSELCPRQSSKCNKGNFVAIYTCHRSFWIQKNSLDNIWKISGYVIISSGFFSELWPICVTLTLAAAT